MKGRPTEGNYAMFIFCVIMFILLIIYCTIGD